MSEERIKSEEDLDATQELTAEELREITAGAKEQVDKKTFNEEEVNK
jgi:hypothetical protein